MVLAFYAILVAASAGFVSWGLLRLIGRLGQFIGSYALRYVADAIPAVVAIAFLMVVEAPAPVLTSAFMLFLAGIVQTQRPLPARWKLTLLLVTVVLGVSAIAERSGAWPPMLPALLWVAVGAVAWLAVSASAWVIQPPAKMFSTMVIISLLPLAAAPLLFKDGHMSLITDVLVISAALMGGVLRWKEDQAAYLLLRAPVVFILAALQFQALRYGAWPCAAASIGVWFAAIAYAKASGHGDAGVRIVAA